MTQEQPQTNPGETSIHVIHEALQEISKRLPEISSRIKPMSETVTYLEARQKESYDWYLREFLPRLADFIQDPLALKLLNESDAFLKLRKTVKVGLGTFAEEIK